MTKPVTVVIKRSDGREFYIDNETWLIPNDGLDGWANLTHSVTTEELAEYDGSVLLKKRIKEQTRSIECRLADTRLNESARKAAVSFFNPKYSFEVYLTYQGRTLWCEGEQSGFRCDTGNIYAPVEFTWSILCPMPYLLSTDNFGVDVAYLRGKFGFPYHSVIDTREVESVQVQYAQSKDEYTKPTSWQANTSGFNGTKRLWTRTVTTYQSGNVSVSEPALLGKDGVGYKANLLLNTWGADNKLTLTTTKTDGYFLNFRNHHLYCPTPFKAGQRLTLSVDSDKAFATAHSGGDASWDKVTAWLYWADWEYKDGASPRFKKAQLFTGDGTQTHLAKTFTVPDIGYDDVYCMFRFNLYSEDGSEVSAQLWNVMLVEGSREAEWSLAASELVGTGVSAITPQYYLSSSNTTQTGGSWVTTCPAWSTGKYIWTRNVVKDEKMQESATEPYIASSVGIVPLTGIYKRGFVMGVYDFSNTIEIANDGDVETYPIVHVTASDTVVNPEFLVDDAFVRVVATLKRDDTLIIDFEQKPPVVQINGVNALNKVDRNSTFSDFVIRTGTNTFTYAADDGETNMSVSLYYWKRYLGI